MTLPMFSSDQALLIVLAFLCLFGAVTYGIAWLFSRGYNSSKSQFLLADRKLGFIEASLSIAATWIWAPSLFVSATQAYQHGFVGLFWFVVPNFFCLILFALLVNRVVDKFPTGYTLSEYMQYKHSSRVQSIYWVTLIGLTLGAFATQILAGAKFLSMISGVEFMWASALLTIIPLTYSMYFGLKSSVVTDYAKLLVLFIVGAGVVAATVGATGGWQAVTQGLYGVSGQFTSIFDNNGWVVFATFGLPTAIGLLSGPFGDQAFWQRAFAIKKEYRQSSFVLGAFLFILVPLAMGLIGFSAAGIGHLAKSKEFVNLELIAATLGTAGVIAFTIVVLSGITSILDSKLCAVSSIAGHDIAQRLKRGPEESLKISKISMIVLASIAFGIANIPGIQIVHLFLIYGALRSSTLLPTLMTLLSKNKLSEAGIFYGILSSLIISLPVFAYGLLNKDTTITVIGSIAGVLLPGIITAVATYVDRERSKI